MTFADGHTRERKFRLSMVGSNLSRFAGVSAAEARRRNPERSEGASELPKFMVGPNGFEPSTSSVSRKRSRPTELRAYT
jgi:hypothetical protein